MEEKKLFHRDFLLVVIGQIISLFGNGILRFAMPLYILQESGSPALFGLVSACSFLPMIFMSPIGGIIADRVNKQKIMVILDTITAVLIAGFIFLSGHVSIVPLIVVTMMLLYGIQGAYSPAVQASIPLLAGEKNLMPANAVVNLVQSLANLLGPIIGGILFGSFGLWPIIIVGGICFAFSAVLELFIRIPHKKQPMEAGVFKTVKNDLKVSFRFIIRDYPIIAKVVILIFCINLFLSSMVVIGMPVIITEYLGLSSTLYGINQGGLAVGGLLGGLLAGVIASRMQIRKSWKLLFFCSLGIFPMGLVQLFPLPALVIFWVLTLMCVLMMVFSTMFTIQMLSFVQGETPTELVGKVISCIMAVSVCAQPLGQALFGFLFEKFAGSPGLVVIGAGILSSLIALYSKHAFVQLKRKEKVAAELTERASA